MKVAQLNGLDLKDQHTLGPTIERIIYFHEKNQQKQLKAQAATQVLSQNYEKSKKKYQVKTKQKQAEIIKRLEEMKKAKTIVFKKQSQHIQKVMTKSSTNDQLQRMNKLEKINQRNLNHKKKSVENPMKSDTIDIFNLTQHPEPQVRSASNSLNVGELKFNKYKKIYDLCEQIRKKSQEKQQKADSNRRMFQDRNRIKELNQNKIEKKIKAEQQFLLRESLLIKKSISKLELSEKRSQEHSKSQRQKSQQKKEKGNKSLQKIRKNRSDLELKLSQKLMTLQKILTEKQKKNEQNKENIVETWISNKKHARMQRTDQTLTKFQQTMQQFNTKMSDMYRRDRDQWGFLTRVNEFKDILIEKNVYENNQLCRAKIMQ